MMYAVTAREMREMDQNTIDAFGIPGRVLMENAGRGAARILIERYPDAHRMAIGVMAGRGNNGGDGFVMARCLSEQGARVTVYLLGASERVSGDAAANLGLLAPLGIPVIEAAEEGAFRENDAAMTRQDLWVDAIFGTGLNAPVAGHYRTAIDWLNRSGRPVFAVDIASGLDADTGQILGTAVRADTTATFAYPKVGHLVYPGAAHTGHLEVIDIGIPRRIADAVNPRQSLTTRETVAAGFRRRPPETHKGDAGHLLVVAGGIGKTGAAAMAARAALRTGAGLVTVGTPEAANPILEGLIIEAMTAPLPQTAEGALSETAAEPIRSLLAGKRCLALGPGIGTAPETRRLVEFLVSTCTVPMVIDADGLNALAGQLALLARKNAPVILTPHPGEMARLCGIPTAEVQKDRIGCARRFATANDVILVLKGARSLVAFPDGRIAINTTGNPGMAAGGMGDVLTGIIAGLITQGHSPESAAVAGTWLHGEAADELSHAIGDRGYLATEVVDRIAHRIEALFRSETR